MSEIKQLFSIKINDPDADFWITRRGSPSTIGEPSKTPIKEGYGITVLDHTRLVPQYLYYVFVYLHMDGKFAKYASGGTNLVNFTVNDVYRVVEKYFLDQANNR